MADFAKDIAEAVLSCSEAKKKKEVYAALFASVIENSDDPAYIFESDKIWRLEHGGGLNAALSSIISEDFMTESIRKDIFEYLKYRNADFDAFKKEMEKITEKSSLPEKEKEKIMEAEDGPLMAAYLLQHCGRKEKKGEKERKGDGVSLRFCGGGYIVRICPGTELSVCRDEDGAFVVDIGDV